MTLPDEGKNPVDIRYDKFGSPIFHEIDGIRYWGREGEAQAYGFPLEECTLTQEQIDIARKQAFQRQKRAEALTKSADAIQKEAHAERQSDFSR